MLTVCTCNSIAYPAKVWIGRAAPGSIFFYAAADKFPAWHFRIFQLVLIREEKLKHAALASFGFNPDKSTVLFHDLMNNWQAEPCPNAGFLR